MMHGHMSERNRRLIRLLAGLLLAVFLPANVIAAPLLYCVGHNGHRAIEFVHAKNWTHATSEPEDGALAEPSRSDLNIRGSHCLDRLLLSAVAKPEARGIPVPYPTEPILGSNPHFQLSAHSKKRAQRPSRFATSHFQRSDPRLRTLRTVVLLN